MKKRMKLLGLLLAGSVVLGNYGMVTVNAAQQQSGPVAGVAGEFAGLLTDGHVLEIASGLAEGTEIQAAASEQAALAEQAETEQAEASEHEVPVVASEYADIAIAQVNNYVNVRSEPNTESEVLGKLYNKSAATVLETAEDGWYRIHSGNVEGYVKAEYVVVGDEELARTVSTRYATVTTTTLFVRNEPTTEAKILTMLPEGDDLVVLDETTEGWAQVSTVEGEGYVSTDYVELSTEYVYAESKAEEEERLAREEAERQEAARAAEEARRAREAEEAARRASEAEAARRAQASAAAASQSGGNTSGGGNAGNSQPSSGTSTGNSTSNGQAVVDYAMQFLGNPYVYGGNSLTNGTDCSGFVKGVYAAFGISLPRTSTEQRHVGYSVSLSEIQPGDIVCYSGHVGIYAGNNTLIHASNERTGITLTSPVTYRQVLAVRRIF